MPRPSVTRTLREGADYVDRRVATLGLRLERPRLLSFLFHSVFEDEDEVEAGAVHPQEGLTEARFRRFAEHLLESGYRFIGHADIERGLEPAVRYAFVTFDDGYANNARILPLLEEFQIPATIYVSTRHVETGQRYWWDVVYCERRRRGGSEAEIEQEIAQLKSLPPDRIEAHLTSEFDREALASKAELDRPLRPEALRELAGERLVTIGNHTVDHAVLTVLSESEIERQIGGAQEYLATLLGSPPRSISYPNGNYDSRVLSAASGAGLAWGITTVRRAERTPIPPERRLELGRFQLRRGADVAGQLDVLRSRIQLSNTARRLRDRSGRR
jgi:peptidoglycan/xylan/chitin deacetylase (PgdA/CDA1 family)